MRWSRSIRSTRRAGSSTRIISPSSRAVASHHHKPVFGLINCCAGKTSGLLTVGAGAAALAEWSRRDRRAGDAVPGIVRLFAVEMQLDIKDRIDPLPNLGTLLLVRLPRNLQHAPHRLLLLFRKQAQPARAQGKGRPQLGKVQGTTKKEQLLGFTIDEFSRLDLSVMDFTEVYADFMDAAKLPDEVQTMKPDIQQKIQN